MRIIARSWGMTKCPVLERRRSKIRPISGFLNRCVITGPLAIV